MKRLCISVGLLVLLTALCWVHTVSLRGLTEQLTDLLTQAQERVAEEDWNGAADLTRQAMKRWEAREGYLHITLHHTDIDRILISFRETLAFLEGQERQSAEYAAANARLITQLELLLEDEQPSLKNLL